MPNEDGKVLKYNHGENLLKVPAIIHADFECFLEIMHSCPNNLEKSYTEQKNKHTHSAYSLFTNFSFDATKNKLDYYRGKYCMERICKDLKGHTMKIINYEEKEMIPKTDKKNKVLSQNVRDHCHYAGKFRGAAHNICNLRYKTPKEIPVVFYIMVLHMIIIS